MKRVHPGECQPSRHCGPRLLVLISFLSVAVVGCAAPQQQAASSTAITNSSGVVTSPEPTSNSTVLETETHEISGVGAVIGPPQSDQAPTVSEEAILAALASDQIVVNVAGTEKKLVSLKLATYENRFGEQHTDGSETPSVPAQLAWVAEYEFPDHGPISGPAGRPSTPPPAGSTCTLTVAMSATTGDNLDSFDFCSVPASATQQTN